MSGADNATAMRQTHQKQLVLELVTGRRDHPTADQIYLDARARDGKISRGTVYRNLSQLAQTGQILQIKVPGPDRYDFRLHPHYHLICTCCGSVTDADIPYAAELDEAVGRSSSFVIARHRTVFEGVCPECQAKSAR